MGIFEKIIREILRPLRKNKIPYCIIGGLAVIFSGVRRGTADFDIVISEEDLERILKVIYKQGFRLITDIDEKKSKLYYCKTLNQGLSYIRLTKPQALKINKGGFNGLFGDIWLKTVIPFSKLGKNSKKIKIYNEEIRIASIDDLIKLKEFAGRPLDKQDIYELELLKRKI